MILNFSSSISELAGYVPNVLKILVDRRKVGLNSIRDVDFSLQGLQAIDRTTNEIYHAIQDTPVWVMTSACGISVPPKSSNIL